MKVEGENYIPTLAVAPARGITPQRDVSTKPQSENRPRALTPSEETELEKNLPLEKGTLLDIYA